MRSGRTDRSTPERSGNDRPPPPAERPAAGVPGSWWLALGLLAVVALGLLGWRLLAPTHSEAALVERFARLLSTDRQAALRLLGPAARIDLEPVTEAEAEARASDYFLRLENLEVVEVLPGVPDERGKQRPLAHHWTLVTRSNGSVPAQVIRLEKGVSPPRNLTLTNPDIIVTVRDGVIVPLRTELPLR